MQGYLPIKTVSSSVRIPRGVTAPLRLDKKHFTAPHGVERSLTASLITNPDLRGYSTPTPDLPGDRIAWLPAKGGPRRSARLRTTSTRQ